MITIQSQIEVAGIAAHEIFEFLMNPSDRDYQAWWPGVHLQFHTLKRCPGNVGNVVYMDELVGDRRVRTKAVVVEAISGKKIVWQVQKWGIRLPVSLGLELADIDTGVLITHTIHAGFSGARKLLDPLFRAYFSKKFALAMDAHANAEFPKLRDLLASREAT